MLQAEGEFPKPDTEKPLGQHGTKDVRPVFLKDFEMIYGHYRTTDAESIGMRNDS